MGGHSLGAQPSNLPKPKPSGAAPFEQGVLAEVCVGLQDRQRNPKRSGMIWPNLNMPIQIYAFYNFNVFQCSNVFPRVSL